MKPKEKLLSNSSATDHTENELIKTSLELEKALGIFKEITQKAYFIALNASIEGARMRSKMDTFSLVASEVASQAFRNSQLCEDLSIYIEQIKAASLQAVAVRNYEMAIDLIDKLDRNLFERNCDVQAWATFEAIKLALSTDEDEWKKKASELLNKLVTTYVVYLDSFLLDISGEIKASANRPELKGKMWSDLELINHVLEGKIFVSELHYNEKLKAYTVLYCAPVLDDDGGVQGIIVNCFDWAYATEMISSAGFSDNTDAYFINSKCEVVAGKKERMILRDRFGWLRAGDATSSGYCGYSIEYSRNGETIGNGFCRTKGYNAYQGKGWSALLVESLGNVPAFHKPVLLEDRSDLSQITKLRNDKKIESELGGHKLKEIMAEIDKLVFEINRNNREVKLLAVNASIQSGVAGPEGEGFSIIANEVATLAKQSLSFVEMVNATSNKLRKEVDHSVSLRLIDASLDTSSKIDRNLFERYCDVQAWSTFPQFASILSSGGAADELTLNLLAMVHKIYEVYHDIYLIDLEGRCVASAINRTVMSCNFSHKEWFQTALSGQVYVSDVYQSEILKTPLITFSSPVYQNGKLVGVIASRFNCNFLNDILRAAVVDSTTKIYMIKQDGDVIASTEASEVLNFNADYLKSLYEKARDHHGHIIFQATHQTKKYSIGFSHSKGYNTYKGQKWIAVTVRPIEEHHSRDDMTPEEAFFQLFPRLKELKEVL